MARWIVLTALVTSWLLPVHPSQAQLISQEKTMTHGLTRAWASQVRLDTKRDHMESLVLAGGMLYGQSAGSIVHAFDAETGRTRWSKPVGRRDFPTLAVAGNERYTAVVNGSSLYLLDSQTARYRWQRALPGPPSAAPVMDDAYVYVMLLNGSMAVYELPLPNDAEDEEPADPWVIRGQGTPQSPARFAEQFVAWTTNTGLTYVCSLIDRRVVYEFRALNEINSSPAHRSPSFFVTSRDGSAYAFHEQTGREQWRFNVGVPIIEPPIVVGDVVLVMPRGHGMYAVSAEDGSELWWAPQAEKFISASSARIYASDSSGRIYILNRETGVRLDMMPTSRIALHTRNEGNDRLYLATASGLVQCLREEKLDLPVWLNPPAKEDEEEEKPADEAMRADEPAEEMPAEEPADDFGVDLEGAEEQ